MTTFLTVRNLLVASLRTFPDTPNSWQSLGLATCSHRPWSSSWSSAWYGFTKTIPLKTRPRWLRNALLVTLPWTRRAPAQLRTELRMRRLRIPQWAVWVCGQTQMEHLHLTVTVCGRLSRLSTINPLNQRSRRSGPLRLRSTPIPNSLQRYVKSSIGGTWWTDPPSLRLLPTSLPP